MVKELKKITFTLLISSVLAFSSLARSSDYWMAQKDKKKAPEPIPEKEKKKEDRGGEKKEEKKGKKP